MAGLDDYRNLEIDATNLDRELEQQAANYIFVAERYVQAEAEYETYRVQVQELAAKLDQAIREEAVGAGKKITEAQIAKEIDRHPDYIGAQKSLISLRARRELMKELKNSWAMRKDTLIQRCISERKERESLMGVADAVKTEAWAARS